MAPSPPSPRSPGRTLVTSGWAPAALADRVAQRPGAEAVDHDDLVEAGQRRVVEVAVQGLERLVHAGAAEVERRRHRPGPLEPDGRPAGPPSARRAGCCVQPAFRAIVRPVDRRRAQRRLQVVDVDRDPHPARLERRALAAPLERRDPALPAAAAAAGPIAEPPRRAAPAATGDRLGAAVDGSRSRLASARARPRRGPAPSSSRARARRASPGPRRGRSTSRSASAACRADRLVALPARPAPLLVGVAQRLGGARLGGPGPSSASPVSPSVSPDRGQRRLERRAAPRSAATGRRRRSPVGQPEPLGDRERLAAAGQADRQAVGRRERLEVELDRRRCARRRSCGRRP